MQMRRTYIIALMGSLFNAYLQLYLFRIIGLWIFTFNGCKIYYIQVYFNVTLNYMFLVIYPNITSYILLK